MADSKMFVPKTINVGYQKRSDTYTGKLAYVIYTDEKGVLRKEASWQSWRDKGLSADKFDNIPTSGFVLNKGVGGVKQSYGWNTRNEYVRVYDPRNFEFEISVANLLFILQECSSIKGKGLEGEFVYSWSGTQLILLPVDSDEYKKCIEYTDRQGKKVSKEDIVEGGTYIMRNGEKVVYLGRFLYNNYSYYKNFNPVGKKHIFATIDKKEIYNYKSRKNVSQTVYIPESGFAKIAEIISKSPLPSYPEMLDKYMSSNYFSEMQSYEFVKINKEKYEDYLGRNLFEKRDEDFYPLYLERHYGYGYHNSNHIFSVTKLDTKIKLDLNNFKVPSFSSNGEAYTIRELKTLDLYQLVLITKNGNKFKI
jgi:hypothetical protein